MTPTDFFYLRRQFRGKVPVETSDDRIWICVEQTPESNLAAASNDNI